MHISNGVFVAIAMCLGTLALGDEQVTIVPDSFEVSSRNGEPMIITSEVDGQKKAIIYFEASWNAIEHSLSRSYNPVDHTVTEIRIKIDNLKVDNDLGRWINNFSEEMESILNGLINQKKHLKHLQENIKYAFEWIVSNDTGIHFVN